MVKPADKSLKQTLFGKIYEKQTVRPFCFHLCLITFCLCGGGLMWT